jgi:hypothetical protein
VGIPICRFCVCVFSIVIVRIPLCVCSNLLRYMCIDVPGAPQKLVSRITIGISKSQYAVRLDVYFNMSDQRLISLPAELHCDVALNIN